MDELLRMARPMWFRKRKSQEEKAAHRDTTALMEFADMYTPPMRKWADKFLKEDTGHTLRDVTPQFRDTSTLVDFFFTLWDGTVVSVELDPTVHQESALAVAFAMALDAFDGVPCPACGGKKVEVIPFRFQVGDREAKPAVTAAVCRRCAGRGEVPNLKALADEIEQAKEE
ncbi:MAG: DnaJ-like cysteine-rich domain-containing protein [Symbiobacteriia bacterium]